MIEVKSLNKTYDRRTRAANTVLHDVTVTLPDRGFVCILGPSGCGKTSLLNAIGGLDTFDNGKLTVDELTVTRYGTRAFELARDRNFGYIFQNYYLLSEHSVAYNVYLGLHSLGLTHAEKVKRVKLALRSVDMERYIHRRVEELSGGQQQRVAIARALARRPRVIFADEPTGNLDEENTRAVCSLLRRASKDSLVVMVTHEESIARFFADRIITLSDGRITSDSESWERGGLTATSDNTIYTGELEGKELGDGKVTLRLFEAPGAAPAEITVAVLGDRIVLKLEDKRTVSVGAPEDMPLIVEGERPKLDIADIDNSEDAASTELFGGESAPPASPGKGLTLPMMAREAWNLRHGKKMRKAGIWAFLALLTALVLLVVGDFINLSNVDPEDFLTSNPHVLSINIEHGSEISDFSDVTRPAQYKFSEALGNAAKAAGLEYDFIPPVNARFEYTVSTFYQVGELSAMFPMTMGYAPVERLDPSTLIYGRMPEKPYEVVVDRQVLEAMLDGDNIVLNSIRGIGFFLDTEIEVIKRDYPLFICGISDSGARTFYLSKDAMIALCNSSAKIMSLDELKKRFPGQYDDVTLEASECILNTSTVGHVWDDRIDFVYSPGGGIGYTVKKTVSFDDAHVAIIISDEAIEHRFLSLLQDSYEIYCEDKDEMKAFINDFIEKYDDKSIAPNVTDRYAIQQREFEEAASIKMDARSIITLSVLILCVVMLYLLCRTQARERLGLVAVYRLLGIPGRKLYAIFMLEGAISALTAVIPAALITWATVAVLQKWTSIAVPLILPWYAVTASVLGIVVCYLFVSVLPLISLLRQPPAKLASKYE